MLFNSLDFAFFVPIVFAIYWALGTRSLRLQNLIIVASSYLFYGWWDWRFLGLIFLSTIIDYTIGIAISKSNSQKSRKTLLYLSIFFNIGILAFFKYFNFFVSSFVDAFSGSGGDFHFSTWHIILPVGISFYTFQTLSYTIDIHRQKIKPTRDFLAFSSFVSFFPQLVAGPIERAADLLPQFKRKRKFDYSQAVDGARQILWGFFKKMVIADNCAEYANQIFNHPEGLPGSTLFLGAIFFAFQIYGDFSGYSDIAIGTARFFGIKLNQNFAFPYFSRNMKEFWRRWHISLSSWFRDYVYIPLGGNRSSKHRTIINISIVFILTGLWHGANWTFVFWGMANALLFLPTTMLKNAKQRPIVRNSGLFPSLKELAQIMLTFTLTTLLWVIFRSRSIPQAVDYLQEIFSPTLLQAPGIFKGLQYIPITALIAFMIIFEWVNKDKKHALEIKNRSTPKILLLIFYAFLVFLIGMYMKVDGSEFIYFQF